MKRLILIAALLVSSQALGADKVQRPIACLNFELYKAQSGAELVVCHDLKRPFTMTQATLTKLPDGRPVAVGFR